MIKNILFIFYLLITINTFAQEVSPMKYEFPKALKSIVPYGTIENALVVNKYGVGIVDVIPRIGFKGKWEFAPSYNMFMKVEVGLNLVKRDDYIHLSADPGAGEGKVTSAVFARLGLIGIGTPYGNLSFGKQWGVHYTLAGNIDDMYIGGGFAIGVYNAGTDGGVSGTGRADQVAKYELKRDKFYIGLQSQFRDISENDKLFADAFSIAMMYNFSVVKIGGSYSKVLDGVDEPELGSAKINDE
jgi:predicted porin